MDTLLDTVLRLHPEDSKTNVFIPFTLERDYGRLEFCCSYEPKFCDDEDLVRALIEKALALYVPAPYREEAGPWERHRSAVKNLITLSVDAGDEYLGCAHRQDSEQRHIISEGFASRGFRRHAARRGPWRAALNVHGVMSGEVTYRLRILGQDDEEGESRP